MSLTVAVLDLLVGKHLVCLNAACPHELTHKPIARAAAATGSIVRTHGRSGLTPQAKKTRLLDEADRLDAESEELQKRYDDYDKAVSSRLGTTDITRYSGSDRRILERLHGGASNRARAAEKLRDEVYDLDKEEALSHTDTLPLDQ